MADPWSDFLPAAASQPRVPEDPWAEFVPVQTPRPLPEPPAGAIIHSGDGRSYIADRPEVATTRRAEPGTRDAAVEMQALQARGQGTGIIGEALRMTRPFAQGQSLNFGDEAVSAAYGGIEKARGRPFSDAYDYAQEFQRQELDRRREEAPITSALTELGGGLSTAFAAAPSILGTGGGVISNALRGMASGATGGAAAGFGGGSGREERTSGAITGGLLGGGIGGLVPVAASGIGATIRSIRNARSARDVLTDSGIGRRTAEQLTRELDRDGLPVAGARAEADRLGPAAMMLDVGDNIAGGAEAVANQPGSGQRVLRERLFGRNAGAPQRITEVADAAIAPQTNIAETIDDLVAHRTAASAPLYSQALDRPVPWNDRLQAFLDDPIARSGLRQGAEIQRLESLARNEPFNPLDYNITGFNDAGDPIIAGTPNMRTLNILKKGLDDIIEGYRDPTSGRLALDERGRAVNEVQRSFINELDQINPDYAAARAAWAGPTRVRDALALGQDVFNRSVRPDQLQQRLAAMSADEREAFTMGTRDQLAEITGTARRDATAARGMFETGWNREKLVLVLGDEGAADQFLSTLGTETRFANRANSITGNSATARRQERAGEYNGRRGPMRDALDPTSGLWGDAKRTVARGVDMVLDGRAARLSEQMRSEFGDAVSRQGAERTAVFDALEAYQLEQTSNAASVLPLEQFIRALGLGGAVSNTAYPSTGEPRTKEQR